MQASLPCDSAITLGTETDVVRSRLGELHRLLNNRKGSLSATDKKTAEANDKAHHMNQKTIQAVDTLAEYGVFEVTMKKVKFEHDEGDVLNAVASEVAEELDRAQNDQDRPRDELDCSCEGLATASKEFSNCWATHEAASAKLSNAFMEVSNRRATHEAICAEPRTAWQKTYDLKRKAKPGAFPMSTPGRKHWSTTAWEHWCMPLEMRPQPHTP